jgi:hypothetical protein
MNIADWIGLFSFLYFLIAIIVSFRLHPVIYRAACGHETTRTKLMSIPNSRRDIKNILVTIPLVGRFADMRWLFAHRFSAYADPPSGRRMAARPSPFAFDGSDGEGLPVCHECLAQSIVFCGSCGKPIIPGMAVGLLTLNEIYQNGGDPQVGCEGDALPGVREIRTTRPWSLKLVCCADCSPDGLLSRMWMYPGESSNHIVPSLIENLAASYSIARPVPSCD